MELAASSAYDTGWLSSFSYTLLLIGSGLSNRRTSYIGVSFSCLWLLPIVFTSNVRLPQGPCHTKDSHDTCCCCSGCWAVPRLLWQPCRRHWHGSVAVVLVDAGSR